MIDGQPRGPRNRGKAGIHPAVIARQRAQRRAQVHLPLAGAAVNGADVATGHIVSTGPGPFATTGQRARTHLLRAADRSGMPGRQASGRHGKSAGRAWSLAGFQHPAPDPAACWLLGLGAQLAVFFEQGGEMIEYERIAGGAALTAQDRHRLRVAAAGLVRAAGGHGVVAVHHPDHP